MTDKLRSIDWGIRLWRFAAFTVFDALAVAAFVYLMKAEWRDFEWSAVPIGVVILWIVQAVLSARGFAWLLLSTAIVEPKFLGANFLEVLRRSGLPTPSQAWYSASFHGLAELADNQNAKANIRVRAAAIFAAWNMVFQLRGISARLIMEGAFDKAMLSFDAETRKLRAWSIHDSDEDFE